MCLEMHRHLAAARGKLLPRGKAGPNDSGQLDVLSILTVISWRLANHWRQ
jgi:hypothetical protein